MCERVYLHAIIYVCADILLLRTRFVPPSGPFRRLSEREEVINEKKGEVFV